MNKKSVITAGLLALSLALAPAQALPLQANFGQLISALNNVNVEIEDELVVVDLANVLRGSNIEALNNSLNNLHIELFSGPDSDLVEIQDVLNDLTIDVDIADVLNDLSVNVEDVMVAVNALTGQVFVLLLP